MITFEALLQSFITAARAVFSSINSGLQFLFNDLPTIGGLSFGMWAILFAVVGFLASMFLGGD